LKIENLIKSNSIRSINR